MLCCGVLGAARVCEQRYRGQPLCILADICAFSVKRLNNRQPSPLPYCPVCVMSGAVSLILDCM